MEPRGTEGRVVADVMTVQEVAEYLKVTTKTVYALMKAGSLASFRIGRAVRCRTCDVEAFILERSESAAVGAKSSRSTHTNADAEGGRR